VAASILPPFSSASSLLQLKWECALLVPAAPQAAAAAARRTAVRASERGLHRDHQFPSKKNNNIGPVFWTKMRAELEVASGPMSSRA